MLADALDGSGRLLLVAGEAGIGKTTLARTIAEDAESRGAQVRWGACWEGGSLLPFGVWIDAMRRPGGDACGAVAAHLAEGAAAAPDAAAAGRLRVRLFGEVVDALEQAASVRPQVVVLEDMHWADASSSELLSVVARRLPSMATVVVATYRDDELAVGELDAIGGAAEWLSVGGLPEPDVAVLLADVLGREPTADEVRSVYAQTGGNPLFVTQVGRLLAAGASGTVPAGVREVLTRRLARLSADCVEVLAVAAVLGTVSDLRDIAAVSRRPESFVLAGLDEAARARLAHPVDGRPDRWSFVHDLVRAVRYESLGVGERAELHRRALDVLDVRGATPAGVLAHHASRARFDPGDQRPAALAVGAAHEALARLAWPEALALCDRALEVAPDGADGDRWRAEALLAAGDARLRTGDDDGAAVAFGEVAALARRHEQWDVLARAALGFASGLASFEVPLMEPRQIALLEEAHAVLAEDSPLRPLVQARLSVALSLMGADDRRLELAVESVRLARRGGDPSILAAAIAGLCDAIAGPDHIAERLSAATEVVALAQRVGDVGLELLGRRHRVVALLEVRDLAGFDAEVAAFARVADRLGDPLYAWYVPLWQAMRASAEGRLDEGEALARRARSIGEPSGSGNAAMLERVVAMCVASDRGDVAALDATWRDLAVAHPEFLRQPLHQIVTAWRNAEADRPDDVRRALASLAVTDLALLPRDQEWLVTFAQLIIAAAAVGHRPMLQAAYDKLLPYAGLGCFEGAAAVDRGVVDRFLVLAAGHLGDLDAVDRHAPAAMEGGEASGALIAAHTIADCAHAFAAAGASTRAAELAADATARYEALGLLRRAARLRPLLASSSPAQEAGGAALVRDGDIWEFTYAGMAVRVRHAKGVADVATLLENSGREVHVRTLAGVEALPPSSTQPALDDAAINAYRGRLRDLEAELDEADRHADVERAATLGRERDALIDELTRSVGLGGRRRPISGDPDERLRKAVSARVKASIDRLDDLHPRLARHLRHSVRTGYWCSYVPEQPVAWHVERHDAR